MDEIKRRLATLAEEVEAVTRPPGAAAAIRRSRRRRSAAGTAAMLALVVVVAGTVARVQQEEAGPVVVPQPTSAPPPIQRPTAGLTVVVSPEPVVLGRPMRITGAGCAPQSSAVVSLYGVEAEPMVFEPPVGDGGRFSLPLTLQAQPGAPPRNLRVEVYCDGVAGHPQSLAREVAVAASGSP